MGALDPDSSLVEGSKGPIRTFLDGPIRREAAVSIVSTRRLSLHRKFSSRPDTRPIHWGKQGITALGVAVADVARFDFDSASPSIIKSIKQRELLNVWLRLYGADRCLPRIANYEPSRLADELPDLVYYTVDATIERPVLTIQSKGTRMSAAYGHIGNGRRLDEYLGAKLAAVVMPAYYECIRRALPVYAISHIDDIYGRIVAYERLLMPFSDGGTVTHVIASLKTISEDGSFEIKNLLRGNDTLPVAKLHAVIDRDLSHRTRATRYDLVEFD